MQPVMRRIANSRFQKRIALAALTAMWVAVSFSSSAGQSGSSTDLRKHLPNTISDEWKKFYASMPDPTKVRYLPAPGDLEGWKQVHAEMEAQYLGREKQIAEDFGVTVTGKKLGGVPVLDIVPAGWKDNRKILVYTHGGAYTMLTARSTLKSAALAAARTGLRVISVDYTNPPSARWQEVTDQVVAVFKALREEGYSMKSIAVFGDSAGGALAAGSVLKLRDAGLGMPAAVVLWSPWADITETGDTYITLKSAEPFYTYERVMAPSAAAYADAKDQKHPYVSPVYGNYAKGYPPTLIQGGTREILLSGFVRLYQALDTAEQTVRLDLYEGMPHVFQIRLTESRESLTALGKMKAFLRRHLKY